MQPTLAVISLSSVLHNANYFRAVSSRPLIAVVKDDGYGHGAEEVAFCLHGVASAFAVATVEEGAALRTAGVTEDVLVLTPPMTGTEAHRLLAYGLTASLTSPPALRLLAAAGRETGIPPRAHLAVNTGMNRYGFPPSEVGAAARLAKRRGIYIEGVFSHYFQAETDGARRGQNAAFQEAVAAAKEVFPDAVAHIAATEGTLQGETDCDAVRIGLGLYGYRPQGGKGALRRAMKIYAYVSNSCERTGEGLGYGYADEGLGCTSVHTLRYGYGDGFFRAGGEGVIGKLCMDAAVACGPAPFGKRVCIVSDFERYAAARGTSVYEALTRLSAKSVKLYLR